MKTAKVNSLNTSVQESLPLTVPAGYDPLPPVDFATPLDSTPRYTVHSSPIGELLLIGDGQSLTALHMVPDQRYSPSIDPDWRKDPGLFAEVERQLDAYFAGQLRTFNLPLAPRGTIFQRAVWRSLTTIPYGHTTTYGRIATALGQPTASRAIGMANGRNPISIIVPCHRVIGADGSLTGYGGGLPRKQQLLRLERSA